MSDSEIQSKQQALAIISLVKENEKLTLIKNRVQDRIEDLHKYNVKMNHKVTVTELMEEELRKIMAIPKITPEVTVK